MANPPFLIETIPKKPAQYMMDRFLGGGDPSQKSTSLQEWAFAYWWAKVQGAPPKTQKAKQRDLKIFVPFFLETTGSDHIDSWTPTLSQEFLTHIQQAINPQNGKPYAPKTLSRTFDTVKHFGRWLHHARPLLAGPPFEGVKGITLDKPDWNGLTPQQQTRCKIAIDQRLKSCTRGTQNPQLEAAVFYALYHTGLRESELCGLGVDQYHHKGFHEVLRSKNKRYTKKVPVPEKARHHLDRYLAHREAQPGEPLFLSRFGNPLKPIDVRRICNRISNQACAQLPPEEHFRLNPHMLRHTFLKRATDKYGVHYGQDVSGNISTKEIFHYAAPSQAEKDENAESLMD